MLRKEKDDKMPEMRGFISSTASANTYAGLSAVVPPIGGRGADAYANVCPSQRWKNG